MEVEACRWILSLILLSCTALLRVACSFLLLGSVALCGCHSLFTVPSGTSVFPGSGCCGQASVSIRVHFRGRAFSFLLDAHAGAAGRAVQV